MAPCSHTPGVPRRGAEQCPCSPTLTPSAHRLQEDQEHERAVSPGDECSGPEKRSDPDPKPRGLSESRGVQEWGCPAGGLL